MMVVRSVCVCATCFVLVTFITTYGFNLNSRNAIVFSDPKVQTRSYFGFTVAIRKLKSKHWLMVGAPRGNSTFSEHQGIHQPGVVYECHLDDGGDCRHLILDNEGNRKDLNSDRYHVEHKKDDSWLGGSIAVQDNGERFLACAPKWKNSHYLPKTYLLMNGACYLTGGSTQHESEREILLPLNANDKQSLENNIFYYAYGEVGFTAHIPQNSTEIVLGAPGVFNWQGTIIRIRKIIINDKFRGPNTHKVTRIPGPLSTSSIPMYSYMGYSLSSGKFLSKRRDHQYVAGSPRNVESKGKVYVFDFPKSDGDDLRYITILEGEQTGGYFGGALCTVDLNGDKLDDLVVAAPQYSLRATNSAERVGDEGRIYVYINGDHENFQEVTNDRMIMGNRRYGARFGTAVANIGDINWDGFEDIAVGAPYEANGVVYVYHGSVYGIKHEPVQVIHAEDINPSIMGFGISFSKGVDVDDNLYNDIAVGAYKSGHAVVLKSQPILTFIPILNTSTSSVNRKMFNFSSTACLSYTGRYTPNLIEAKVTMQIDLSYGRATFVTKEFGRTNKFTHDFTLNLGKTWCQDFRIENRQGGVGRTEPLLLVMEYGVKNSTTNVPESGRDGFCGKCPIVDPSQPTTISTKVAFETGCGSDVCKPNLIIDAQFVGIKNKFVLGVKQTLQMEVEVKNTGEPAFLTRATLVIPRVTPIIEIPSTCNDAPSQDTKKTYTIVCEIGNPLEKNYTINLLMNMKDVPVDMRNLTFYVNVTSAGEDVHPNDNFKELVLPLEIQADMTITGISGQDQIGYMNKDEYVKNVTVNHKFQVWNLGPSAVELAEIEFHIPQQYVIPPGQEIFMRILEPTFQGISRMTCTPVGFNFWTSSNGNPIQFPLLTDGEQDDGYDELNITRLKSLSKRSILNTKIKQEKLVDSSDAKASNSNFNIPPSNRTLFLNCSNPKVDCFTVKCSGGPFIPGKTQAVINFEFKPDFKVLDSELSKKDIILFSSSGKVTIKSPRGTVQPEGHRPDIVDVHTRFIGTISEESVATWIIVLAIICGIIILFLLAMALYKMGFFNRTKKEELQALKNAEVPVDVDNTENFKAEILTSEEL